MFRMEIEYRKLICIQFTDLLNISTIKETYIYPISWLYRDWKYNKETLALVKIRTIYIVFSLKDFQKIPYS